MDSKQNKILLYGSLCLMMSVTVSVTWLGLTGIRNERIVALEVKLEEGELNNNICEERLRLSESRNVLYNRLDELLKTEYNSNIEERDERVRILEKELEMKIGEIEELKATIMELKQYSACP